MDDRVQPGTQPGPTDEGDHVPSKLVTLAAVGALTLGGAALAGTALAATGDGTAPPAPTPSYAAPAPAPHPDAPAARAERIKQALAGLVADKTLTQAQADKVAAALAASGVAPGGPGGGRKVGPGGLVGPEGAALPAAAKALGMSESDLRTQLRSGKSLAAVAKDKGVNVQKVVDALVAQAKQRIADAVKNGRLTQAQADQRLKDLTARITAKVNATRPDAPGRPGRFGGFGPGGPAGRGPGSGTPAPSA
jgi:hypothetical protein